jgi:hypothetical protein
MQHQYSYPNRFEWNHHLSSPSNPVVLSKSSKQKLAGMNSAHAIHAQKMSGAIDTEKKIGAGGNKSAQASVGTGMKKLEESTEVFKHGTVDQSVSKAIAQTRLAKKLTRHCNQ